MLVAFRRGLWRRVCIRRRGSTESSCRFEGLMFGRRDAGTGSSRLPGNDPATAPGISPGNPLLLLDPLSPGNYNHGAPDPGELRCSAGGPGRKLS